MTRPAHCPIGSHWRRGKCVRSVQLGDGWSRWAALLGAQIRSVREEQDVAASELAAATGVSESIVHKWERGAKSPPMRRLKQIADALGVQPVDLLPRSE